mgnify:CR=1 FL=1
MSLSSDRNAPAFELIVDSDSGCFCSYTFSTGLTPGIEKAKSFRRRMLFTRTKNSLGELSTLTLDVPVAAVPGSTIRGVHHHLYACTVSRRSPRRRGPPEARRMAPAILQTLPPPCAVGGR